MSNEKPCIKCGCAEFYRHTNTFGYVQRSCKACGTDRVRQNYVKSGGSFGGKFTAACNAVRFFEYVSVSDNPNARTRAANRLYKHFLAAHSCVRCGEPAQCIHHYAYGEDLNDQMFNLDFMCNSCHRSWHLMMHKLGLKTVQHKPKQGDLLQA